MEQEQEFYPELSRREIIERNKAELARRKEAGELDQVDFENNYLYYLEQQGGAINSP